MRSLLWSGLLALPLIVHGATVVRLDVDSVVHPISVEILTHALDQAVARNAEIVLIRIDTPGGLLEASREFVTKMMASPVPVVTYVGPTGARAASAGFFLLLAGDVAAMAPGTRTGAASPVLLGQELDAVMRRKIENDTQAWLRSLSSQRGRNASLAETAVSDAKSFTDQEALKSGLIDLIAKDEADLFRQLEGRTFKRRDGAERKLALGSPLVVAYEPTLREKIVKRISDPNLALVLLVAGALGLYVEFSAPGLIVPGVLGGILALLGLAAFSVLPVNWLGVALLLLAVALFVLEAKFTSHGILGAGGALAMVLGALFLVEGPPEFRIHLSTAIAVALPFALISIFLTTLVLRARGNRVETGASGMIGEIGVARTALSPQGSVFVHGELWEATCSVPVEEGRRVRVRGLRGLHLEVDPVE